MTTILIRKRSAALAALGIVIAMSITGPAHAVDNGTTAESVATVPGGNVTVEVVAANGTGCPPGTARVTTQPDKTGFRISYQDFVAEAGGNADTTVRRRNCQIAVQVNVPAGWTFAIAEAEYRGRARLHEGANGLQRTNYYWQGSSSNEYVDHLFSGPLTGFWNNTDVAYVLEYRPCDSQRILNINTELRVDEGTSTKLSSLSMRTTEGDVDTLFRFDWKAC